MNKLSIVKVGITSKFKVRYDVFKRGEIYTTKEIIAKVRENGWLYSGNTEKQNKHMIRSAINEGILTGRIVRPKRGRYIFLDK